MALLLLQAGLKTPIWSPTALLDIALVAFLIYQFFLLVRGRRAAQLLYGVTILVAVYLVAVLADLQLLRSILSLLLPYTPLALIVIFQSEIRRALMQIGWRRWLGFGGRLQRLEAADEILLAVRKLHQQKIGALIVLERDTGLRTFVESGVRLDAHLSRDLLLAIFKPGGELHDGAVIVQDDKIAAAACFLPLSMNTGLARSFGTRHRAAVGITEETDSLAIVVSEQTGAMSVASSGEIEHDVSLQRVDEIMAQHFGRRASSAVLLEGPVESDAAGAGNSYGGRAGRP